MTAVMTVQNAAGLIKKYGGITPQPVARLDSGLVLGIYGPGGVGKTTLAASITDSEYGRPGLLLDAGGNPHVVSSYSDRLDVLPISNFAQQEAVRQDILRDREFAYKSIILDNVTEMFHYDLRDRYGPSADVDWTKHSATTSDVLQMARNWRDLAAARKVNIIFVFQEVPETRTIRGKKVEGRSEISANKALQFQLPTIISFLGRLYIQGTMAPFTRVLDFTPNEELHQSKIQIDPKDEYASQIPVIQYNPSLASIVDTIRGHQPWPVAKHAPRSLASKGAATQ